MIKSKLEVKFRQVKLKYQNELRSIDFHINSRKEAGLVEIVRQLETKKEMLMQHINELEKMETDFENSADKIREGVNEICRKYPLYE